MLERVQRAWDRFYHRPLPQYRRVGTTDRHVDDSVDDDWYPMMTASLYCPSPDGELALGDCRRPSTETTRSDDDWGSLTLDRAKRRCRCTNKATVIGGDRETSTDGLITTSQTETLPRFKSPVLGRRLRALVAHDLSPGSVSCPGSPRDITRLSAAVGRRLHLGLSPRLCPRRSHRRSETAVDVNAYQPRLVFTL